MSDNERESLKLQFLHNCGWQAAMRDALPADASFRRYERLNRIAGASTELAILMDAPPAHERVEEFVNVDRFLLEHGFSSPKIFAEDKVNGFLLLEDFGNDSYSKVLQELQVDKHPAEEIPYYDRALEVLMRLHKVEVPEWLPVYSDEMMLNESMLLVEWYIPVLNGYNIAEDLIEEYKSIWAQLLPFTRVMPTAVTLRDYHADNLMVLKDRYGYQSVGLLDFQDAVIGSPVYDIVSLLEDARRDVAPTTVSHCINRYLTEHTSVTRRDFLAAYSILGAQRNCKILGIFARKAVRDKNSRYLRLLPRVWQHLQNDLKNPLLLPLSKWLSKAIASHGSEPSTSYAQNARQR